MPQQLKYVAQLAMDNFYQNYKGEDDFWDLEDFISMCGNTVAGIYLSFYQQEYAMLRSERNGEGIAFDAGWLSEQEVIVEKDKNNRLFANLDNAVMTFPYDKNSTGIQNVFVIDPYSNDELERTSISEVWQLKYVPFTNRIFFYSNVSGGTCDTISKLGFVNKGNCNLKKVRVLYVPVMEENANIPDGLIGDAIAKTVLAVKQMANGNVVDQTADQNSNKVLQTEIDKNTLVGR